ncbi:toxin glutamine deamidase domain-containing protein [Streptomyces flavidovirens]|uniref:toxin glutamine deamidase domain-containing protein n=1 Tax=Streptomyces flavidovirens TaxID=67298 RepID=UPI00339EAE53
MTPAPNGHTAQPTPQSPNTTPRTQQGQDNNPKPPTPTPASATRNTTPPGGVTDPTRAEQDALDNSIPRDENGDPTRPPDPEDGPWVQNINGDGPNTPGRNNNCVDVALSTVDTYAGNPTAAAARTPDLDADGNPSDRGERGGRDRIENTLGARFSDLGNGRDAFNRLENTLRNSGHGSQAVIITQDANGRAHAWNAVNHNGKITYIDAQTGRTSPNPLHSGNNGVFAIPLDSNRQPISPDKPSTTESNKPAADRRHSPRTISESPSGAERRPAADPAGTKPDDEDTDCKDPDNPDPDDKDSQDKKAGLEQHPDDDHSRLERERGDTTTLRSGLPPDDAQARVRETNPVFRLQHGHVDQQLQTWADNGQLAHVLKVASGQVTDDPNVSPDRPRTFTADGLNKVLPGFSDLNRGERMLVISTLARLSHSAHEQYGVNSNPLDNGKGSEGVAKHKKVGEPVRKMMQILGNPTKHKPDLTQRNFAVVELQRDDGTIEYVTDSSFPNRKGVKGLHSESHLADWIDEVNKAGEESGRKYKITALYTEREPCGDKKGGLKSGNCSDLLGKRLAGVPVYYSTTYRADQAEDEKRTNRTKELQQQRRVELNLGPRDALPKQAKQDITRQVKEEFPLTPAEEERNKEIKERVDKVRDLWKAIAPTLQTKT